MGDLRIARSELILGGNAAGKVARAQALADAWLAQGGGNRVVYIATAQAWDADMRGLVDRHRGEGGEAAQMVTVEEPTELAHALGMRSRADTLIVVDCLTLWLTASLMQALLADESDAARAQRPVSRVPTLADAVRACAGPLVLVSHQLDAAALPARKDSEAFLETLGALNQQAARACERVTLMAGCDALTLKGAA